MKSIRPAILIPSLTALFVSLVYVLSLDPGPTTPYPPGDRLTQKHYPADHFFWQRTWPDTTFALKSYERVLNEVSRIRQNPARSGGGGFDAAWTLEGPGNIGGRINAVAVHPADSNIIYTGSASGGVHKTIDGGQNWFPVFDDHPFLAIGDITLNPGNPNTVFVGTGDPNISGYPAIGDGLYKSTDGGSTWMHLGLTAERIISRIVIDPVDTNTIYVATMGLPFERNSDRGLYKSTNGGLTWAQVLYVADQAGIIDLLINPVNPDILYAASWDRIRNNSESTIAGPHAKLWKTTDGGSNWNVLTGGLPTDTLGRIGLAMSGQNPEVLYALYQIADADIEGIYKTTDGGANWTNITGDLNPGALGGFGWYFGQIRVNPINDNELWVLGVQLYKSSNGGVNWQEADPPWWQYQVHADKHDLVFGVNGIYLATDGGLYLSANGGSSWQDIENIPNSQFYRVAVNPHQPDIFYGGMQDNGSSAGNAAGFNNWSRIFGGDGFQMAFDANDPLIFYCETQAGGLVFTNDGGGSFNSHTQGIDGQDRQNWDMPFMLSAHNSNRQYTGTFRVYRNSNGPGGTWQAISPDLTDGLILHPRFHTITTVNESALDSSIIYAGTTDGNVWRTTDGGANWLSLSDSLPDRYVTSVKPSPVNTATAFVTHSGYKDNEFIPHIHKSSDFGTTWTDISGNLPQLAINDLFIYPTNDSILFVGTDGGVYGTLDGGVKWERVGNNMPIIPVYDLEIEPVHNKLVAGTFARSLMTFSLDTLLNPAPPGKPAVSASGPLRFCEDDSVVLTAPAGHTSYRWSNGAQTQSITVLGSGAYTVQITDVNGCQSPLSDTLVTESIPLPIADFTFNMISWDTVAFFNNSQFATGYLWDFGEGTPVSTDENPLHIFLFPTSKTITLIVSNECGLDTSTIILDVFLDIDPTQLWEAQVDVYPIPATEFLYIGLTELPAQIQELEASLFNLKGQLILEEQHPVRLGNAEVTLGVRGVSPGVYLLRLRHKSAEYHQRIIIR